MRSFFCFGVVVLLLPACAAQESPRPAAPTQHVHPAGGVAAEGAEPPHQVSRVEHAHAPHTPANGAHAGGPPAHSDGAGYAMDFSHAERFAKHFDDPARDAWQRPQRVVEHLQVAPGHTVADIGAGTGYFLPYLTQAVGPGGRVLALDVEPNMVAHMTRRIQEAGLKHASAKQVAADDPGLTPSSVDRVLIVNTWHHIGDRVQYATKLAQALTPDGRVLIVDFTRESDVGPPPEHRLSAQQVVQELKGAGLAAEVIQDDELPKQYLVRAWRP